MNDELGIPDEVEKLLGNFMKTRLGLEIGAADAVDAFGALIDISVGIQEAVIVATGQAPVHHLETANLDDAVALLSRQAGGFGI
jgi:hypothetical protein